MRPRIIVLSGRVAVGKSQLAAGLVQQFGAEHVQTRALMTDRAVQMGHELHQERGALQKFGRELDEQTGGRWLAVDLARIEAQLERDRFVVVDSIRIVAQLQNIYGAFGRDVVHVHLTAPVDVLSRRYSERTGGPIAELSSYGDVQADATEAAIDDLQDEADIVIDTDRSTVDDVLARCAARAGLLARGCVPCVDVIVGGQYGSEGKGNIAFFLAPEYDILMRVGGPNAGHRVPLGDGYTHRLLPSGTRANERAHLLIGPGAVLDVNVLLGEIADCGVEAGRLTIDPNAIVIEPWDVELERRLVSQIGSTGKGVGAATARRILGRGGGLAAVEGMPPVRRAADIDVLRPFVRPSADVLESAYAAGRRVMLEGTQGTALSLFHGHYPHVTSRDTTSSGCLAEAGIGPRRVRRIIGVFLSYPIRVQDGSEGTSGPMTGELDFEEIGRRSGIPVDEIKAVEKGNHSGIARGRACVR